MKPSNGYRIVVKLGGRTQGDEKLPGALAALWESSNQQLIVVHGGGDQISALQRAGGEEPEFIGGRRVTTPLVLDIVRMVLSGLANKQLVAAITRTRVSAVGISGEDGNLLTATPIDMETFGLSGSPDSVDGKLVETLLNAGYLPVISPVARHSSRHDALNVNGDDAAAALAAGLGASELFLLADVEGVLDAQKNRIASMTLSEGRTLIASGVAAGGMAAKLDAAAIALNSGVKRVRIGNLAALRVPDGGTSIMLVE